MSENPKHLGLGAPNVPLPAPPLPLIVPTRDFQCPRGHTWKSAGVLGLTLTVDGRTPIATKPLCPFCLVAFLDEHFGGVEEAKPIEVP